MMDDWKPETKVAAGAIAALVVYGLQLATGVNVPPGIEGAVAVTIAYIIPSSRKAPLE